MDQFEQDTDDLEERDFVKISYDHSMNDERFTESGVVNEIVDDCDYPMVSIECGGGKTLRLTWNRTQGGAFGVVKVGHQDTILGNDGEIELLHRRV